MIEWWDSLTLPYQVFYGVGIVGTVLLLVQLLLMLIGGLEDVDATDGMDMDVGGMDAADGHVGIEHATGLHILSTRTVVAFMTGFGWTGAFALREGLSLVVSLLIAFVVGVILMWLVFLLMRMLYSLRDSGSLNYRNAVGKIGTVYVRIPPGREGEGQIQIEVQGRLSTTPACSDEGELIPSGRQVRVVGLVPPRTLVVSTQIEEPMADPVAASEAAPASPPEITGEGPVFPDERTEDASASPEEGEAI
jgi:membrane protein implicated in regulation of membrane protease activity